jgi:RNA polymerase sigma-70 factor (ECF subfamily)
LLSRLKDWNDQDSWRTFFDTYWKLIYHTAIKAGLSDTEAEDVVQETVLSVSKSMKTFEYDQAGSFKHWLLTATRWRIQDQFKKRQKDVVHAALAKRAKTARKPDGTATGTATIDGVADPLGPDLDASWDEEWELNLLEAALTRVKRRVDPAQFQIFDLHVLKEWPVSKVARALRISRPKVYLIKHRINKLLKKEIARLRTTPM